MCTCVVVRECSKIFLSRKEGKSLGPTVLEVHIPHVCSRSGISVLKVFTSVISTTSHVVGG